jgi:hypothetical protein
VCSSDLAVWCDKRGATARNVQNEEEKERRRKQQKRKKR